MSSTNNNATLHFFLFTFYKDYFYAIKYGAIPIVVIGNIGNLLSFVVLFSSKFYRNSSSGILMMFLAFFDTLDIDLELLMSKFTRVAYWPDSLYDIRAVSQVSCVSLTFLTKFAEHMSSWIIVLLTVERCICVVSPTKARTIWTARKAMIFFAIVFVFVGAVNSSVLAGSVRRIIDRGEYVCLAPTAAWRTYRTKYRVWVDAAMYSILPFLFIATCNTIIIVQLNRSRIVAKHLNKTANKNTDSRYDNLTRLLLTVNMVFITTTLPYQASLIHSTITSPRLFAIFVLMKHSNHAINFFIYCLAGSFFREQFATLIRRTVCGLN
ncbi:FMRFamide receptor-like [Tubulanus polymorphus]|uniref:FMRFamide receptor-like n=1 Tax=Tubulanus polymorphus TaxID=672921 RepID=UPI003DA65C44